MDWASKKVYNKAWPQLSVMAHSKTIKGGAVWVLKGTDIHNNLKGTSEVPGAHIDQSAYRSKLVGILAALSMIRVIYQYFQLEEGSITIGCNNTSAIFLAPDLDIEINTRMADHDILFGIWWVLKEIPIRIHWEHVKGHQDEEMNINELSKAEQLNCEMDQLAKEMLKHLVKTPAWPVIAGEPWSVWLREHKLVKHRDKQIYDHVHGEAAKRYWGKKGKQGLIPIALTGRQSI